MNWHVRVGRRWITRVMSPLFLTRRYELVPTFNVARSLKALLTNPDGLSCSSPQIPVVIVTPYGNTAKLRFIYDTGADLMVIPVYVARHQGIPFRTDYPGRIGSSLGGGVRCYYDYVQVRSSLSGKTHRWVCAFADSLQARLILGRAGFHDDFATAVEGGHLVVRYRTSLGGFLKHLVTKPRVPEKWLPI